MNSTQYIVADSVNLVQCGTHHRQDISIVVIDMFANQINTPRRTAGYVRIRIECLTK